MAEKKLIEAIKSVEHTARPYSGRGMYGRTCVGVVTEDEFSLGVSLALALGEDATSLRPSTDSMGRSSIIVYFRNIPWPEDYTGENEKKDDGGE